MKTLDEIIKALEVCTSDRGGCGECPFNDNCKPDDKWDDALHYLYEYRSVKHLEEVWQQEAEKCKEARERFTVLYKEYQERISNIEPRNLPLTWDELKQMEGKPVWTEDVLHDKGEWLLINDVIDDEIWYADKWADKERLNRDGYGRLWQAYRKERS